MERERYIDAVLFDFGGVFTDSPFAAVAALAAELDVEPARLLELVFGPYHDDTDHPWHRVERGELALAEARELIIELGEREGIESDPFRVLAMLRTGGEARAQVVERVRRLRTDGYRTAIVTNNAREFREAWLSLLPFHELFDTIVDSSEEGVRKPDPKIYLRALERLGGIAPERAVFLDDFPGNVDGAVRVGIHGIVVGDDPQDALAALDELLARPAERKLEIQDANS